jgi:hypothetical protein
MRLYIFGGRLEAAEEKNRLDSPCVVVGVVGVLCDERNVSGRVVKAATASTDKKTLADALMELMRSRRATIMVRKVLLHRRLRRAMVGTRFVKKYLMDERNVRNGGSVCCRTFQNSHQEKSNTVPVEVVFTMEKQNRVSRLHLPFER